MSNSFNAVFNEHVQDCQYMFPPAVLLTDKTDAVRIIQARGMLVVTDEDLVALCGTTVDAINKAVLRNVCVFPCTAAFRMTTTEWHHLKRTAAIKDVDRGQWLTTPLAFTDTGVLALSKILATRSIIRGCIVVRDVMRGIQTDERAHLTEKETTSCPMK